jgi:hypothetical protein
MAQTRKQRGRAWVADLCNQIARGKSVGADQLRATNRRVDMAKGRDADEPYRQRTSWRWWNRMKRTCSDDC